MDTYIDRLHKEKDELLKKIKKLEQLVDGDQLSKISTVQISMINIQHGAMVTYYRCLEERISWIKIANGEAPDNAQVSPQ